VKSMDKRAYNTLTAALFLAVAVTHLLRIVFGWSAQIGGLDIPLWVSWLAVVIGAGLAYWGLRQNFRPGGVEG